MFDTPSRRACTNHVHQTKGAASYMNDVVTWGMAESLWKPFDRILALINTIIAGVIVSHHHVGEAQFPPVGAPVPRTHLQGLVLISSRVSLALLETRQTNLAAAARSQLDNRDSGSNVFSRAYPRCFTCSHARRNSSFLALAQFVAPVLSTALVLALYCKWRSANALHVGDCASFLVWHSGWHYSLPLMASGAIWSLPLADLD
jgi:hypothetical protein